MQKQISDEEKFREITSPGPRVIRANTLDFKPIFECLWLEIVGDARPRCGVR